MNGDGYSDILIGSPWYTNGENREGRASLYLGSAEGIRTDVEPDATFESNVVGAQVGYSVAGAGDTNGDGYDDILVVTQIATRVGLYLGSADEVAVDAPPAAVLEPPAPLGILDVAGAGDFDGDGHPDVLVSAHDYAEGRVSLYLGNGGGVALAPTQRRADAGGRRPQV